MAIQETFQETIFFYYARRRQLDGRAARRASVRAPQAAPGSSLFISLAFALAAPSALPGVFLEANQAARMAR